MSQSLILKYSEKEKELKRLQEELEKMENDPKLQMEKEFKDKLTSLMEEFGKSSKEVLAILGGDAPAESHQGSRRKRKLKIYKNPETGEVVETRGGNQKTLKSWKDEFGAEVVEGWLIEERD